MTTVTADGLDLLRTAAREPVTYAHSTFFIGNVETDVFTAHLLRNLILAGLLERHGPLVLLTDTGRDALS